MIDEPRQMRPLPAERRKPLRIVAITPALVAEYADVILRDGDRWIIPADHLLVKQVARNLVIADQIWGYLEARGYIDNRGRPRGSAKSWLALQNTIGRQLSALGFSPLARAELGANLASSKLDAAQAMRYGRPRSDQLPPPRTEELGPGTGRDVER